MNFQLKLTLFTMILGLLFFVGIAYGGECLETRQEMLDGYNEAIENAIHLQAAKETILGENIKKCWVYWDPNYKNGELNIELGNSIKKVLSSKNISEKNKIISLEIASRAAPKNLFNTAIDLINNNKYKDISYKVLFNIWAYNFKDDKKIANYDYFKLIKKKIPEIFNSDRKDCEIYTTLSKIYRNKYEELKEELIAYDLYNPIGCDNGYDFFDPRAFEDTGYKMVNYSDIFFQSIARHLDLEFKKEWLNYLSKEQLYILRNSIFAKYGYKFKSYKLKKYFKDNPYYFCHYGSCGKTSKTYSESLLSDLDKKNIELISAIENGKVQ